MQPMQMLSNTKQTVVIDGQQYELEDAVHLFAAGGQAKLYKVVIKGVLKAVKIYLSPTRNTLQKVKFMIDARKKLPLKKMIWPEEFVTDTKGNIIGFVMPLLPKRFTPLIKRLDNNVLRKRVKLSQVIRVLIKLHPIIKWFHDNNILLADVLTTNNICFDELADLALIDLDSLESGDLLCTVLTPGYVPPEFPVKDLGEKPSFSRESDWYAFTCMVFEMIFGFPPFGGPHPDYHPEKDYFKRAADKAWVFDDRVPAGTVPDPVTASVKLFDVFERMFIANQRFEFPLEVLEEYLTMLVECPNPKCGKESPNDLEFCPFCGEIRNVEQKGKTVVRQILDISSNILYASSIHQQLFALTVQAGETWIHKVMADQQERTRLLTAPIPETSRFEPCGRCLFIGQPDTSYVFVFDTQTNLALGVIENCAISIDEWPVWAVNNRRAYFARFDEATSEFILFKAIPHQHGIAEEKMFSIGKGVVRIAPITDDPDSPVLVIYDTGGYQVFNKDGSHTKRTRLSELPEKDSYVAMILIDRGDNHLLVRRVCHGGKEPVVISDIITADGKRDFSKTQPLETYPSALSLQTGMYVNGCLLHANKRGVLKEDVRTGKISLLSITANVIHPPARLFWHNDGVGITYAQTVQYIPFKQVDEGE